MKSRNTRSGGAGWKRNESRRDRVRHELQVVISIGWRAVVHQAALICESRRLSERGDGGGKEEQ